MSVTKERQVQIILDGLRGTHGGELSRQDAPAKGRCDLDVTERRGVEARVGRLKDASNLARAVRFQEVLDKC